MDITEVSFHYPPQAWGGAERYARQIGQGLAGVGHNVRVVTSSRSPKGSKRYRVGGLQVAAYPTAHSFPYSLVTRTWNPMAWLRNHGKGAVAHVHNVEGFSPLLFRSLKRTHQAVAWTAHDPTLMCGARMLPRDGSTCTGIGSDKCRRCENVLDRLRRRMVNRHMLPSVDALIPPSEWMRGLMADAGFPEEKIHVIRNGIDLSDIPRSPVPDEPVMMFCGQMYPEKGLMYALKAYQLVLEEIPDARFTVVGDGTQYEEGLAYARKNNLDGAFFTGRVTDPLPFYHRAKVVVHPSVIPENSSLVLLEAHAVGRPSVATRVGGNAEIVHEGYTGLMTDSGQEGDLAHQLIRILDSTKDARAMGRRARIRAERQFRIDQKVDDHARLFNRLVSE